MKKITCDKCGNDNARSYKYCVGKNMDASGNGYENDFKYIDLCFNHVQDFVLEHKVKLMEITNLENNKKIIHG